MKASPLLRAWTRRLEAAGVGFRTRWRWQGWRDGAAGFATPEGPRALAAAVTVLALGGGSWARLGSDGAWTAILAAAGVPLAPFRPSNVGFRVAWSPAMARHFGQPVKPVRLTAAGRSVAAEFVVSARGVEGGGIYALARPPPRRRAARPRPRPRPQRGRDRRPPRPPARRRLARQPPAQDASASRRSRSRCCAKCAPAALGDPAATARALKALPLPLAGPRPLDEAISTAGGVAREALDAGLMLRARPGVFCAGEMLDWDAPTGGYLLTACLATGRHAGRAAARWR